MAADKTRNRTKWHCATLRLVAGNYISLCGEETHYFEQLGQNVPVVMIRLVQGRLVVRPRPADVTVDNGQDLKS